MAFIVTWNNRLRQLGLSWYTLVISAVLLLPGVAAAQATTDACGLIARLTVIAKGFSYVIGLIAVLVLLYAGFLFLTGSGNEETVKKAKSYLIFGLVGLAVAMVAFSAVPITQRIFIGEIITSCPF